MKYVLLEGWAVQRTRSWALACFFKLLWVSCILTFALPRRGVFAAEMFSKQVNKRMESGSRGKVQSPKRLLRPHENVPKIIAAGSTYYSQFHNGVRLWPRGACMRKEKRSYQSLPLMKSSTCRQIWKQPLSSSSQHSYSTAVLKGNVWV